VVDAGSGSGIAAITAVMAGAKSSLAVDSDPAAALAARLNAEINNVFVETATRDLSRMPVPAGAVILAGDLWYERLTAVQATAWLRRATGRAAAVLLGDCRRGNFPRHGLEPLASYAMQADTAFESTPQIVCGVWRMTAGRATAACPS
jgi:predicted nicotinamide N-methyase